MRTVRIATYQLPAEVTGQTPGEIKESLVENLLGGLREAGQAGADLVCFGETCTTYHVRATPDDRAIFEDALDGPTTRRVRELAATYKMNVALPIAAYWRGRLGNLVVLIDRGGEVAGGYAKVHPTRGERAHGIVPGDDFPVVSLDFGKVGAFICHDLSFVESARVLALRGAEVLVWPNLWSGWGEELCEAVIKSRAIDNGCWLVRVGYGYPPDRAWRPGMQLGRSGVIGPDGVALSSRGRGIGLSVATVDLDAERIAHSFTFGDEAPYRYDMLADRRPDAYGTLVDAGLVPPVRDGRG
ncbi:MAG TPA: carbon-nitrogen hydrolase family protein [Chloroflexota bacterium]|nr:carbon-nitrogen hydrolase family protein [Chloroflexota bacterium]